MSVEARWVAVGLVVLGAAFPRGALAEEAGGAAPLADDPTLIALAVALSCAEAPEAVEAPPAAPPGVAPAGPELELVATVRAKSLRFDQVPSAEVLFRGTGRHRTVWKTERVNLPLRPEPGVTYHDVQVRLTVTSDLDELTAMLRDAKRASRGVRIDGDPPAPAAAAPAAPAAAPVSHAVAPPSAAPATAGAPSAGAASTGGALPPVVAAPPAPPAPPASPAPPAP